MMEFRRPRTSVSDCAAALQKLKLGQKDSTLRASDACADLRTPLVRSRNPSRVRQASENTFSSCSTVSLTSSSSSDSSSEHDSITSSGSCDSRLSSLSQQPSPLAVEDSSCTEAAAAKASFDVLLGSEHLSRVPADFLHRHPELNSGTREAMVDWLQKSRMALNLLPETLFLAANLMDRYLGAAVPGAVTVADYWLTALAALHAACKYEEVYPPGLASVLRAAGNRHTHAQVLSAELSLLSALSFRAGAPTTFHYLTRCLAALRPPPCDATAATCGRIAERMLLTARAATELAPSELARAAVAVGCALSDAPLWRGHWFEQLRSWGGGDRGLLQAQAVVVGVLWSEDRLPGCAAAHEYLTAQGVLAQQQQQQQRQQRLQQQQRCATGCGAAAARGRSLYRGLTPHA
jgi:Cyclin, N-terminal domain